MLGKVWGTQQTAAARQAISRAAPLIIMIVQGRDGSELQARREHGGGTAGYAQLLLLWLLAECLGAYPVWGITEQELGRADSMRRNWSISLQGKV